LIRTVEKIPERTVEADRQDRRAKPFEILWNEPLPELFAERQRQRRDRDSDDVTVEVEPTRRICLILAQLGSG
jgi:hypothetical protein